MPRRVIAAATPCSAAASGPAACLDGIERNAFAFEQHPAQHVLRRPVAGLGRRAVEIGGTRVILFDALALEIERGQISSTDRVAALRPPNVSQRNASP